MRIKLDENLPAGLTGRLSALGHDVETAPAEGLGGKDDVSIWQACHTEKRFLITQDLDFSDARRFIPGTHPGILLVRVREPSRRALTERIEGLFKQEDTANWEGCLVVATDRKLRVRQPES
ncbi:MAG TPA: DUF5615 family PIN-like protein [Terriglobia bacterium]|nr:DUF5615 family PIN-like protein [Terriglobia bacterium]